MGSMRNPNCSFYQRKGTIVDSIIEELGMCRKKILKLIGESSGSRRKA